MAEALADRLAEAFAEKLHVEVRKDYWGYAPEEKLSTSDLLKVKYQVRRLRRVDGLRWCSSPLQSSPPTTARHIQLSC